MLGLQQFEKVIVDFSVVISHVKQVYIEHLCYDKNFSKQYVEKRKKQTMILCYLAFILARGRKTLNI